MYVQKYSAYQPKWDHNRRVSCPGWLRYTEMYWLSAKWDKMVHWKVTSPPSGNDESKLKIRRQTASCTAASDRSVHTQQRYNLHPSRPLAFFWYEALQTGPVYSRHFNDTFQGNFCHFLPTQFPSIICQCIEITFHCNVEALLISCC